MEAKMETSQKNKSIVAAVIQIASQPGRVSANQRHALPFIETAVSQGAQLIVLPELFASGYIPNQTIWQYGETLDGSTVTWLRQTAARLGVYLGAGFVEIAGDDFYNSFALAAPDGELAGCARKTRAETYCFKYGDGRHLIETALGKIGVGICADNHYTAFLNLMRSSGVDLALMPHASPTPYKTSRAVSQADIEAARQKATAVPLLYARALGVPVLFVNPVGDMQPMSGLLGRFMTPELFRLQGQSCIVDSDGTLHGPLEAEETVLTAKVRLGPTHQQSNPPPDYDGWLHPGSKVTRKALIPIDVILGRASYSRRKRIRQM
jgi:N-carbamoylputrescine amidase